MTAEAHIIERTLADLQVSEKARVSRLCVEDGLKARLLAMGLASDQELELIRIAPGGGPLHVRVGTTDLMLRRLDALAVQVY